MHQNVCGVAWLKTAKVDPCQHQEMARATKDNSSHLPATDVPVRIIIVAHLWIWMVVRSFDIAADCFFGGLETGCNKNILVTGNFTISNSPSDVSHQSLCPVTYVQGMAW